MSHAQVKAAVDAFIPTERQWSRWMRIDNAKLMLGRAMNDEQRLFWVMVLDRLGAANFNRPKVQHAPR